MDTSYKIKNESTFILLCSTSLDKYRAGAPEGHVKNEFKKADYARNAVLLFAVITGLALVCVATCHAKTDWNTSAGRCASISTSAVGGALTLIAFRYFYQKINSLRENPQSFFDPCYKCCFNLLFR